MKNPRSGSKFILVKFFERNSYRKIPMFRKDDVHESEHFLYRTDNFIEMFAHMLNRMNSITLIGSVLFPLKCQNQAIID